MLPTKAKQKPHLFARQVLLNNLRHNIKGRRFENISGRDRLALLSFTDQRCLNPKSHRAPLALSKRWSACLSRKSPKGANWTYEIKLDGYRLEAVRSAGETTLFSRRKNVLNKKFHYVAEALEGLPNGTVIDGELVALGADGHPNFNLLQNFRSAESRVVYYVFDILIHKNRDLTQLPLSERRKILSNVRSILGPIAPPPGMRSGLWSKYRINLGQEFVIGGYIPSNLGVDSLVVGFYRGKDLIYAARVRAGFVPATRREVFEKIKHLKTQKCPFKNLPELVGRRYPDASLLFLPVHSSLPISTSPQPAFANRDGSLFTTSILS